MKKLSLSGNQINNIKSLNNLSFGNLKEKLRKNKMNDISGLEGVKMTKIEKLFLEDNDLSNIKPLEKKIRKFIDT